MHGLMSNKNLLISSLLEHSDEYHGNTEIAHRLSNGKIEKTNYKETSSYKKLSKSLIDLGINTGDILGTIAWSNIRHLELYYGISGIGAVCHTINQGYLKNN